MKVKLQYVILRQGMENQSRFSSYAGMKYAGSMFVAVLTKSHSSK